MAGMVYLVGAGPGDYRLISMKAVDCLKMADVVVYDRLADDRILRWAPAEAEYIYVGKASSNHTMKQEDINQLLVDKAKEGKCVVRLKGGDPFVFGRGGEEGLLLRQNNLPFEIVPGITSAISVPAYAGIPVTHRAVATSFAVVTGHEDPTKGESNMRWEHLAMGVDTLVFLMGVANLPHITSKLMENGRSADTPAAVIRWGTKPEQRTLITTVGKAAEDVAKNGIKPPAIFIVGEVVKLRDSLQWFDNLAQRPLFGKRILVTRARSQASKLTAKLENLGAEVIEVP
ncbi:MAG: uroporphyrinogen-III C-methyltransferase, partial [Selenomonas sp.]|nr:uroporphyrinogen-III C-methyltransferase [Selenomonas sp.]